MQDVLCVEFLPTNGNVVTGMSSGDMYIWKPGGDASAKGGKAAPGFQADRRVLVPNSDPKRAPSRAHLNALQVLQLRAERSKGQPVAWTLLSGGGGGKIKIWGNLEGEAPKLKHVVELPRGPPTKNRSTMPKGAASSKPAGVKALDCFPGSDELVVGTDKCDIYKVKLGAPKPDGTLSAEPTLLVKGHNHRVSGLDKHPTIPGVFVTCSRSDKVIIWEASIKSPVGEASLPGALATSVSFRPDAKHLAVGTEAGQVFVYRELNDWKVKDSPTPPRLTKVSGMHSFPIHDCVSEIAELKYSPDSRTLAVASHDQYIDLYDAEASVGADGKEAHPYIRLRRCGGHSSTVMHLDWSVDSRMLQSQCQACAAPDWPRRLSTDTM